MFASEDRHFMTIEQAALYERFESLSRGISSGGMGGVESEESEAFLLTERLFNRDEIDGLAGSCYRLGTGHRQYFSFERYPKATLVLDNAHNCLAGLCVLQRGVFVFHDPPMRIYHAKLSPPRGRMQRKIIGGGLSHWESTRERYERECGVGFRYIFKPGAYKESDDYSFALIVDMAGRVAEYGYYYNPKGLSGDGWNWE
jgi:hypothetical protein